ncbi:penicillin acylase family protein [Sandarakinorhabdus rubra]|uniref:penicillin acylase family protein n=1 Tax=Sandarakinorhabdus rubra TaxID=2672568 RepID=UPI0013DC66A7|nr:penicillin acylase family protein [Sandarakinorhabdus rubra]
MPRWFGALFWSCITIAAMVVGLASWDAIIASPPAADPVRPRNVRIERDRWGVPHIHGRTDADVAYGIAVAHAEDDFRNLEEVLAAVRGRAGAILGEEGAQLDFAGHLLDARAVADAGYASLSPATRALVEAYAQGLNDYADSHRHEQRLQGLFPVTGRDIVAGFVLRSPFFFGYERALGALVDGKLPPRDSGPVDERGSNAFAVSAARSDDATTRLIINSHQPWEGGVTWWELVVHSQQGWDFAGATFPGAPFPLLGHNRTLGWANTVNRPDLVDVYRLTLNEDRSQYRLDGRWLPLESQRVWLRVKFGPLVLPVPRTIHRSRHGAVILNDLGGFAIRHAGIGEVAQIEQYYRLNKARDFAEWQAIMAMQAVPATNFVYADRDGHIAMVYNAKFPDRRPGFDWKGVLPGDTSATLWTSYRPWNEGLRVVDPAAGWVGNANNRPDVATAAGENLKAEAFAPELGVETHTTNRMHRFAELFGAINGPIGRAALLRIKFDKAYSRASPAGRWMARVLALDTRGKPDLAEAQALLKRWDWTADGRGPADSLAVAVMASVGRQVYRGDPLPPAEPKLREVVDDLMATFGRLDVPLGDYQRLRHGPKDLPVYGGPDTLRAIYAHKGDDGRRVADNGDGFIMLVEWPRDAPVRSQSIHQFGAATIRRQSPHYADQAPLFVREEWKKVDF